MKSMGSKKIFESDPGFGILIAAALTAMCVPEAVEAMAVTWGARIEVASGDAFRGPWRMNESEWHFVDDSTVAITEQGDAGVAWADHARHDIFFQVYGMDGRTRFAEPVNVSKNPETFSWLPRVVMTPGKPGEVYILWQEIIFSGGTHGGEILFGRSENGGKSFSAPINLSNTPAGAGKGRLTRELWYNGSLDLAGSPGGNLYAAWTVYEGGLFFSRSTDRGRSFSDPLLIAGGKGESPARGPSLVVHGETTVRLAWTVGEERNAGIYSAVSDDAGRTFEQPRKILQTSGHSEGPKIAADETGSVHLVFGQSPDGPLQRYHIDYARSAAGKDLFSDLKKISGRHSEEFESVNFPCLDLDDRGNVYVLWEIFPERGIHPRGLGFTFSNTGGRAFAPPVVVPGTLDPELGFNGSQQGLYMNKLAVNNSGDIAIVNSTFKQNKSSHIWLIRGRVTGR